MRYQLQNWTLELGNDVIATIIIKEFEFPWTHGKLVDSPKFERYRVFFSDEDDWPETLEFDELCNDIVSMGRFTLHNVASGEKYTSFRLNHEGESVWFRFS